MTNFPFDGWIRTPLQLFDAGNWSECVHATIQALNVRNDPALTQQACEDTGFLHELSHLSCGIEINAHATMDDLREQLEWTDQIKAEVE